MVTIILAASCFAAGCWCIRKVAALNRIIFRIEARRAIMRGRQMQLRKDRKARNAAKSTPLGFDPPANNVYSADDMAALFAYRAYGINL